MLEVRRIAHVAMAGRAPFSGPISVNINASYAIPASWSKRKRAEFGFAFKTSRADVDNLAKAIMDAIGDNLSLSQTDKLGAIVFGDDAAVCRLCVEKRYGFEASVSVGIFPL